MLSFVLMHASAISASDLAVNILWQSPVSHTPPEYLSIAIDQGVFNEDSKWQLWLDHQNSSSFLALTRGLTPAYLRIGGTPADTLLYNVSAALPPDDCFVPSPPKSTSSSTPQKPFLLSACQFSKMVRWAEEVSSTDLPVLFDLNVLSNRSGGNAYNSRWDPTNALTLITYARKYHSNVVGWELGNEPEGWQRNFGMNISNEALAADFHRLRSVLDETRSAPNSESTASAISAVSTAAASTASPLHSPRQLVVGPDWGMSCANRGTPRGKACKAFAEIIPLLNGTVDMVTFHYYNLGKGAAPTDFVSPAILDGMRIATEIAVKAVQGDTSSGAGSATGSGADSVTGSGAAPRKTTPSVWLGESATASGGGLEGASGTYTATFIWLDKLGQVARWGGAGLMRQSLFGGSYALLDPHTFKPRPTYWVALLFKRLTAQAPTVLAVEGDDAMNRTVRVYARCGQQRSAAGTDSENSTTVVVVVVFGTNIAAASVSVTFDATLTAPGVSREDFVVTGKLGGGSLVVNGRVLAQESNGSLPTSMGGVPAKTSASPLGVPPLASFFAVFRGVGAAGKGACM
jgi:heparanase 1